MPPLRDRRNDILLLADYFLKRYAQKYKKKVPVISRESQKMLLDYPWYGNVRELQHVMERVVILADTATLKPTDFMLKPNDNIEKTEETSKVYNLETLELQTIEKALKLYGGNISKAAKELGLTRAALYRRMEKYGL